MKHHHQPLGRLGAALVLSLGAIASTQAAQGPAPVASGEFAMAQWGPHERPRDSTLTRAEVRDSMKIARLFGLMSPGGEGTEPEALLMGRETFNALQAEVYAAEALRGGPDASVVVK